MPVQSNPPTTYPVTVPIIETVTKLTAPIAIPRVPAEVIPYLIVP